MLSTLAIDRTVVFGLGTGMFGSFGLTILKAASVSWLPRQTDMGAFAEADRAPARKNHPRCL
jgi:hypothetical protein